MWLTTVEPATRRADLAAYRAAVAALLAELTWHGGADDPHAAAAVLAKRLDDPELAAVLTATPSGLAGAVRRLAAEIRSHRASSRGPAADLIALIRIYLFAQIDAMWWGSVPMYVTDAAVLGAADLVDLEPLRRAGRLGFRYRRQAETLLARAARSAERRAWPGRTPRTAGVRFAFARPEAVALLNQLSAGFAAAAPAGTPPLWVTSLVRSIAHQQHLRSLGYAATLPSSHCAGYAMDIEFSWFRRYNAHQTLAALLLDRQDDGDINVIDEGQVWHVCISPTAVAGLRRAYAAEIGG
jgi:hypothetical protein